jgi:hypothetical protein
MRLQSKLISIIITLLFVIGFQNRLHSFDYKLVLLTSDRGILYSSNGGRSWDTLSAGLPRGIIPLTIQSDRIGNLYLTTFTSGIFRFDAGKATWEDINSELFLSPFSGPKEKEYRKISAFALNNEDGRIVTATKHAVFQKEKDKPWAKVAGYPAENYCTALAINKTALYAGTSYNGLYRMLDSRALNISSNMPREQYSKKYFFYEEIAAIDFGGKAGEILYAGLNFGGGVYVSLNCGASWKSLGFPASRTTIYSIFDIKVHGDSLFVSSDAGIFKMDKNFKWYSLHLEDLLQRLSLKICLF